MKNYRSSKHFSLRGGRAESGVISEAEKYENHLNFPDRIINSAHRISIETAAITEERL
jgi:hypothetical protein